MVNYVESKYTPPRVYTRGNLITWALIFYIVGITAGFFTANLVIKQRLQYTESLAKQLRECESTLDKR
jgi:hypothetical protein